MANRSNEHPPALGRMYFIKPMAGEVFYLRLLLTVVKGPTSFEDLRTVPGHPEPFPTFHGACLARGLDDASKKRPHGIEVIFPGTRCAPGATRSSSRWKFAKWVTLWSGSQSSTGTKSVQEMIWGF